MLFICFLLAFLCVAPIFSNGNFSHSRIFTRNVIDDGFVEKETIIADSDSPPDQALDSYNPIFIFMGIVYTISTLSAIVTNLIVILVYILGHRAKTDLSIFLINLAVADFLMSTVCMPFTFAQALLKRWIFGEIMCPIGKNFLNMTVKSL